MQSLALGTHLYPSLIRSTHPSQSLAVSSSLGCYVGSKMALALYTTLVGGDGGQKDFIVVMGAKLLNCSILRCTRMWVGGLKQKEGQTASKSEISELSSNCGSLRCSGTTLVWISFWIS
jgi:hypothetical protein